MALFSDDKNLAMELVRSTEAAVMASGRWFGRGSKNDVDRSAVEAMRYMLRGVAMKGSKFIGPPMVKMANKILAKQHLIDSRKP